MKLLILSSLSIITGINEIAAQTTPDFIRESTFVIGTSYKKLNDGFILSSPGTGSVLSAGYRFIKTTDARKLNISLDGNIGSLSNVSADIKTQSFDLRLAEGFSLLKSADGKLNSYWGYSISANPSFVKARYKYDTRQSWATFNDLSLYQSFVYTVGRNRITLDVSVPVIGLSSRPLAKDSWHNTVNGMMYDSYSNLFFTSWKNRRSVSSTLDIRRRLNGQINILAGADFKYNQVKQDDIYKEIQVGCYAGVSLSFK